MADVKMVAGLGYCLKIELVVCGLWKMRGVKGHFKVGAQPLPEGMMVPFTEKRNTGGEQV